MIAYERSAFLPDIHFPYQDPTALAIALRWLRDFDPHHIFLLGDVLDFYALSRFIGAPDKLLHLQAELDQARDFLDALRRAHPRATITYLQGNHEARLTKYLWSKAPELSGLRGISVPNLLEMQKLRCTYVETGTTEFHGLVVKHGNVVRRSAGYSGTGELDAIGTSGISGHTHRLAQIYRTNHGGMYTWIESGCLCSLKPEYAEGQVMNWQHGLSYGLFKKSDSRFLIQPIPIVNGCLIWNGREVRP